MNAHDLQIIYEVFKLPDAVGSSTDNVVSEVMVSGEKIYKRTCFHWEGICPSHPTNKSVQKSGEAQF